MCAVHTFAASFENVSKKHFMASFAPFTGLVVMVQHPTFVELEKADSLSDDVHSTIVVVDINTSHCSQFSLDFVLQFFSNNQSKNPSAEKKDSIEATSLTFPSCSCHGRNAFFWCMVNPKRMGSKQAAPFMQV